MKKLFELEILKHERISTDTMRLTLGGDIGARPGQFVQVQVSATKDPLLRRPLSIHNADGDKLVLLYRKAGRGTSLLQEKRVGDTISLLGPLGTGFTFGNSSEAMVVAGGIGAAPLYYLLRTLAASGKNVSFFYGAKSSDELLLREEYRALATTYREATDDGTAGQHGFVTDLVKTDIARLDGAIYACGPDLMLHAVAQLAREHDKECFVSLEAHMACGVGACLGCVVSAGPQGDYRRVCVDGPVFNAREVF
jgi:dihydroorotate dehydrogenase electron transfer subunit